MPRGQSSVADNVIPSDFALLIKQGVAYFELNEDWIWWMLNCSPSCQCTYSIIQQDRDPCVAQTFHQLIVEFDWSIRLEL